MLVTGKYDVRILMLKIKYLICDVGVVIRECDDIEVVAHICVDYPIYI